MSDGSDNFENYGPDLLDLHLGSMNELQADALRRRIALDSRLARENHAIESIFDALNALRPVPAPPSDLLARTLARVARATPLPVDTPDRPAERPFPALPPDVDAPRIIRFTSLRDVLAVAAMIVLAVGLGVPSILRVRGLNQRLACSANLAQIGTGLGMYASTFGDALPFAGWNPQRASWRASDDPNVENIPNRRHMYPLLYVGVVRDPARFICPSQFGVPMAADQVKKFRDFPDSRNVSFAYQNMAGVRATLRVDSDLPLLADDNPLFDNGHPLGLKYGPGANSRAHNGDGQNVLTAGGRVRFFTSPDCGVNNDNIWTLNNVRDYTGREGPATATDSHLLK